MYGHAIAVVRAAGLPVEDDVVERAVAGLRFLLERRRRSPAGLVELCHPWESGCDDSPRWDGAVDGSWTIADWYEAKGRLLETIERSDTGAPLANPAFAVGAVGFSALVAWNALELGAGIGDGALTAAGRELAAAVDGRWDPELSTWVDDGAFAATSGRVRTADSLLPLLVVSRPEAMAQLTRPDAFGAPFGPTGVHRAEPSFAPQTYWRGPAWPQLTYLSWRAARWAGDGSTAASLQNSLASAARTSRFSEYWDPDTGVGLGAAPQSWSTLAAVVAAG
jgi:glycogen debranching enzyme